MLKENDVSQQMYCWDLTGICDDKTSHCNLGYYDIFDLLIIFNLSREKYITFSIFKKG